MRKDCKSCHFEPDFEFFSPTSYDCIGYCEGFGGGTEIVETEDNMENSPSIYLFEGKAIVDCPCWTPKELKEEVEDEACSCDECSGRCDPHPLFEKEIGEILSQKIFPPKPSDEDAQKARERLQGFVSRYFGSGAHLRFID